MRSSRTFESADLDLPVLAEAALSAARASALDAASAQPVHTAVCASLALQHVDPSSRQFPLVLVQAAELLVVAVAHHPPHREHRGIHPVAELAWPSLSELVSAVSATRAQVGDARVCSLLNGLRALEAPS